MDRNEKHRPLILNLEQMVLLFIFLSMNPSLFFQTKDEFLSIMNFYILIYFKLFFEKVLPASFLTFQISK
jgi:hypothetical protein